MTLISDDRIAYLAQHLTGTLHREGLIAPSSATSAVQAVRQALGKYCLAEADIDQRVRVKIGTLKRGVAEGSREWEILYQQYYEEEIKKMSA